MRFRNGALCWLVALAACAGDPEVCDPGAALADASQTVQISEGGRGFLVLPRAPEVRVAVRGLAPGFTSRVLQGETTHTVVIGAPWGITGRIPAELVASCETKTSEDAVVSQPVFLEVRAVRATTWSADGEAGAPPPRSSSGMALSGRTLVIAGGTRDGRSLDDVWTLDLDRRIWTELRPDDGEGPSGALSAVAVPDRAEVLVLDENAGITRIGLDGREEVVVMPGVMPVGPGASMRYDEGSGRFLVLCGQGVSSCPLISVGLDAGAAGGAWVSVEPSGFAPAARGFAVADVDLESNQLVLFGGTGSDGQPARDGWSAALNALLDGSVTFRRLGKETDEPTPRTAACGAVDPLGHRLFVFGGTDRAEGSVPVGPVAALDLERDDARWREVTGRELPAGRVGCGAAWDPIGQRIFVGFGADSGGHTNELWSLDLSSP